MESECKNGGREELMMNSQRDTEESMILYFRVSFVFEFTSNWKLEDDAVKWC